MITRSNLAEQLREYQIRSKHDWTSSLLLSSPLQCITLILPLFCSSSHQRICIRTANFRNSHHCEFCGKIRIHAKLGIRYYWTTVVTIAASSTFDNENPITTVVWNAIFPFFAQVHTCEFQKFAPLRICGKIGIHTNLGIRYYWTTIVTIASSSTFDNENPITTVVSNAICEFETSIVKVIGTSRQALSFARRYGRS